MPDAKNVSAPPGVMEHTPFIGVEKKTDNPVASVDAVSVGVVPKFCAPGLLNVIVCAARGVTLFEAFDAGPVPALLVALTVNV